MVSGVAVLRSLVVALVGAVVCVWLRTPLPWLIGPLVAVATGNPHRRMAKPSRPKT
jgi:uncharacterized membrane protein AbrB (regulator of aidB expression)